MNKKKVTVKQFAAMIDEDYIVATAVMKLLVKMGAAVECGKVSAAGGRGKPSTVYELDQEVTLEFWQDGEPADAPIIELLPEVSDVPEASDIVDVEAIPAIPEIKTESEPVVS